MPAAASVNDPQDSLTQEALLTMGHTLAPKAPAAHGRRSSAQDHDVHTGSGYITTRNEDVNLSWLLPHQTGTRDLDTARAVCSTRTPNGAFAQRALAVYGRS